MNIPQGYKQTELGMIPEDWEIVTIGQIADITTGNKNTQDAEDGGKYPFYVRSQNVERINTFTFDSVGVVTAGDGVGTGKIFHYVSGKFGLHQRAYLIHNFNNFSARYFYWYFSQNFYDRINQMTAKSSVDSVRKEMIEKMAILQPPVAEQRAIAEALSDVDGLIAALDKKIAKKRLLKQGAMLQLLTGKTRLPGFADEWVEIQVKELGKWSKGQPFSKDKISADGKNLCIHYGELFSYGEVIENIKSNTDVKPSVKSSGKDVLFPASDVTPIGLGRCSSLNIKNVLLGGDIIILEVAKDCPAYISYVINLNKQQIIDRVTGTTVKHINSTLLGEIKISISTSIKEQQAIATILSDMDKEIADLEAQRDKYCLLKSGMMQKLLTGQIRLVKPLAKIIPLVPEVSVVREIPVDAHIIAGHIVNKSYQSRGWGRTKLQKSLHLVGYCMQLNLGNEYIRNTAGPDDQQLMNYIDQKFKQYRHVNKVCEKLPDGRTHYSYTPTPMIQEVEAAYERYPQELREQIDALIDKLNTMDLAGAEILSTLYAVWNNRIIKGEQITDDLLIADFYAWSEHKADFEETRVRKALNYMRKENIVPTGWGKYIDQK